MVHTSMRLTHPLPSHLHSTRPDPSVQKFQMQSTPTVRILHATKGQTKKVGQYNSDRIHPEELQGSSFALTLNGFYHPLSSKS
jgi:hypothetical protein